MRGEIIELHLFDVGGTLDLAALEGRLAGRDARRAPRIGKGTPPYVEFPQPLVVSQPSVVVETALGALPAEVTVYYYPIGAVSIHLRVAIDAPRLEPLHAWDRTVIRVEGASLELGAAARALLERDRAAWEPAIRDRYTRRVLHESYSIFAFHDVGEPAEAFLERHRDEVAGLLTGQEGRRLHEKEVAESSRRAFSYYHDDLTVVDWDAAFIVDPDADYEDIVFVLEIANLQLLEFRAYDAYLDDVIRRAYDELERLFRRTGLFRNARHAVHELSLMRIEIAELADEADNITKFLGDWWLARVYHAAQEKFHLQAWRATVDEKVLTLNKLYSLANEESDSLRMITLELLIVLLFIVDLLILFFQ